MVKTMVVPPVAGVGSQEDFVLQGSPSGGLGTLFSWLLCVCGQEDEGGGEPMVIGLLEAFGLDGEQFALNSKRSALWCGGLLRAQNSTTWCRRGSDHETWGVP